MIAWFALHLRSILRTFRDLRHAPVSHGLGILVLGLALALPAGLYVLLLNASGISGHLASDPKLSVFMKTTVQAGDEEVLNDKLRTHPWVKSYQFIPKDEALKSLAAASGLTDVSAGLDQNPLPDAFVVIARTNDPKLLARLKNDLSQMPGVDQVQYDARFARRLAAIIALGHRLLLLASTLLGIAIVILFAHTTRLSLMRRREEIELCTLIGATPAWIRRPFLWAGTIEGLLAGAVALLILQAGLASLDDAVANLASTYGSHFSLTPLSGSDQLTLVGLAAAMGWAGAWLASRRAIRIRR